LEPLAAQRCSHVSSDAASSDEELISQTLAARHLKESVEQLPSHERQVLLLHVNNGLTYWEIAARLGMEEEVVLRDLAHAYSQLRFELSAEELRR
jgi:DNA-directed RNA polymerase specialized sigma24 family protein